MPAASQPAAVEAVARVGQVADIPALDPHQAAAQDEFAAQFEALPSGQNQLGDGEPGAGELPWWVDK